MPENEPTDLSAPRTEKNSNSDIRADDPDFDIQEERIPLTETNMLSVGGISALGAICSKALLEYGQVTFFLNQRGIIEIAPPAEVSLDALPEEEALNVLLSAGYTDEKLSQYLRQRDARRTCRKK
jgi:hypothetical protein